MFNDTSEIFITEALNYAIKVHGFIKYPTRLNIQLYILILKRYGIVSWTNIYNLQKVTCDKLYIFFYCC